MKETTLNEVIQTKIYQMTMLSKSFAKKLNVVIIVKSNLKTGARTHVILFSSDLDLDYAKLIDYYKLRFQIEFNFRDAKQYWALFKNPVIAKHCTAFSHHFHMSQVVHPFMTDFTSAFYHNPRTAHTKLHKIYENSSS
ncbi:MAG: hypothetical protein U9N36_10550 [Euryarchaeota archaeon]|nr:hypothetical protein [Euryarchaeota archaeon]